MSPDIQSNTNSESRTKKWGRSLGRKGGRKRTMTDSKIASAKRLLSSGVPPRDVAKVLGVSFATLYRWIQASDHEVNFA